MNAPDPRIPGLIFLGASAVFLFVKRRTTGSFVKGKPEGGFFLWFTHLFNLAFLLVVNPAAAVLLVVRRPDVLGPAVTSASAVWSLALVVTGLLLYLLGCCLMVWALAAMRGHFQVLGRAPRPEDRLLQSGPYALVRHPMYSSVLGLSLGLAVVTGSLPLFAIFLVYVAILPGLIAGEEKELRKTYGDRFAAYQARVRKLIPALY